MNEEGKLIIGSDPIYICPVHGETKECIVSAIEGHEGLWCSICALDKLDELGVPRVILKEVEDE